MVKPVEFAEYFAPTPIPFWARDSELAT